MTIGCRRMDPSQAEGSVPAQTLRPAFASLPGATGGLPISLTTLVGRERELLLAQTLLHRPEVRLLTLTGPGGIGKTRLAIQLAADLAESFEGGVRFVPLASVRDANLVTASIAYALDVQ